MNWYFRKDLLDLIDQSASYYENAVLPKNTPLLECVEMEALHKFHYQINMHLSKIGKELELMTELTQVSTVTYLLFNQ